MQKIIKGIPAMAQAIFDEAARIDKLPKTADWQPHKLAAKTVDEITNILAKEAGPKGPGKNQTKLRKLGRQNPNSKYAK